MEQHQIACLEIGSSALRLVVGYQLGNAPIVTYATTVKSKDLIKDDKVNLTNLSAELAKLHDIRDEHKHINIKLTNVSLVLPSAGLKVYANEKSTNIVRPDIGVSKVDVANAVSLVMQQQLPEGLTTIDVIPEQFILADGSVYSNPPIGKKTAFLQIQAKVYCLPLTVKDLYTKALTLAGFRISKTCVSSYTAAKLLSTYKELPSTYVLLDIGSRGSTVSFIGEGSPYGALYFYRGGDDLSERIASDFGISFEQAESLKIKYGYEATERAYSPSLVDYAKITQRDLNRSIEGFFSEYISSLNNAVETLLSQYSNPLYSTLPIICIGGGSKLNGLTHFLTEGFPNRPISRVTPRSIGARDPSYANLLGMLLSGEYSGSFSDTQKGVVPVNRVSGKGKRGHVAPSPEDDAL